MVAMTAEYRIRNMHGTLATACVADVKSAVRWVRANAVKLGVDPDRIAAGGGSAGGHVAACTGVIDGFESKDEDDKISSAPNAMVLFNPPCVLAPVPGRNDFLNADNITALKERMGAELCSHAFLQRGYVIRVQKIISPGNRRQNTGRVEEHHSVGR